MTQMPVVAGRGACSAQVDVSGPVLADASVPTNWQFLSRRSFEANRVTCQLLETHTVILADINENFHSVAAHDLNDAIGIHHALFSTSRLRSRHKRLCVGSADLAS